MDKIELLRSIPIFADLTSDELSILARITYKKFYHRGEVILTQEDTGETFLIISSGTVKVTTLSKDGREVTLSLLYDGDFFGELSVIDGEPRSATVVAQEDTELLSIYRKDVLSQLKSYPEMGIKILQGLSKRLRRANEQIENLAFRNASGRVASVLLRLAKEKGKRTQRGIKIPIRLTDEEIGSLAGIRRETANRVLGEFRHNGSIEVEKKQITILSEDILTEYIYGENFFE